MGGKKKHSNYQYRLMREQIVKTKINLQKMYAPGGPPSFSNIFICHSKLFILFNRQFTIRLSIKIIQNFRFCRHDSQIKYICVFSLFLSFTLIQFCLRSMSLQAWHVMCNVFLWMTYLVLVYSYSNVLRWLEVFE